MAAAFVEGGEIIAEEVSGEVAAREAPAAAGAVASGGGAAAPSLASAHPAALLAAALALLLLLALVYLAFVRPSSRRRPHRAMLLLGPSGAGKTSLLFRLKYGAEGPSETVTSMEANEEEVPLGGAEGSVGGATGGKGKRLARLVDLPGHPRLRVLYDDWVGAAAAVVYVVDAERLDECAQVAAEGLVAVLRRRALQRAGVRVLLACNKMDRLTAYPVKTVVRRLEKEIEALRSATTLRLDDIGTGQGADSGLVPIEELAPEGKPFSFQEGCPLTVTAAAVSAATGKLDDVQAFLAANWR